MGKVSRYAGMARPSWAGIHGEIPDEKKVQMDKHRIGLIVTHSADDPERATLPFMLATVALTMGVEPFIVLQGEGVRLGVKGFAETVRADGLEPVEDLLAAALAAGHTIMVCSPCLTSRGLTEADLREGTFVGGAAKIVEAMDECSNFLTY